MDAWKNAKAIEEIRAEINQIKQHIVTITELILKKEEPVKEEPVKKSWVSRDTDGDKNENVQSKQHKS
jgi:hypothetical protein